MQPYYDEGGVTLYLGDARDILPTLDLDEIQAVITDPPYGETSIAWDRWPDGWPTLLADLVPERASLWCWGSFRMFLDRATEFERWTYAQELIWEKHNGSNSAADRFRRVHELAVQWYRGPWGDVVHEPVHTMDATARQVRRKGPPATWRDITEHTYTSEDGGPRLMRSVLYARGPHRDRPSVTATRKPAAVLDPLVRYSTTRGGVVLDPFAGSGSTLRAARCLGRRAVGIEAREAACAEIVERLAQHTFDLGGA